MGFSKKKSKNWKKANARVGAKAKRKAKEVRQIQDREELKASKRRAAVATGRKDGRRGDDDDLKEVKSVDDLFASMADEDVAAADNAETSDDESSAGAFHDVDDDGEADLGPSRGVVEELEDEELGPAAGAKHEEELKAIKEKDPEFYKFLVEQDRSLLDFRAPPVEDADGKEDQDDEEGPEAAEGEEEGAERLAGEDLDKASDSKAKVLTRERLERIQASAKDSFTACKAAINIYHIAVRSIEQKGAAEAQAADDGEDEEADEDGGKKAKKKRKKAAAARKARSGLFRIDDEAIFSEVIEWSISNVLGLLKHHAGDLRAAGAAASGGGKKKMKGRKGKKEELLAEVPGGPVDPTRYARWLRVRVLVNIFWEETFFLLNHLVAQHMLEYVLRTCSTPEALSWLWPLKTVRQRYLKRCCHLWATAPSHNVRLLSFLFVRNCAAMVMHAPDSKKAEAPQLESLIRLVIKAFAEVASWGYSWKSLSTFRFMENCILELLRLEDATAYRLGYVCLRQLALILRNACLAVSQGGQSAGTGEKSKKKKAQAQQQAHALHSWPFIRAISLWTRAVGSVPVLRPLAYPLSMITMGAVKHKLMSLQHFPFVYHCLSSLNRLGASMEVFIPISSHLLKALSVVMQAIEKSHKKKGNETQTLDSSVKAPELEVCLRLSDGQLTSSLALEAVGSSLCFMFTDHLGLLSQSPAFPELIVPVMMHLRKASKQCRSEPLRRQLKTLVERCELSAASVKAKREQLTEVPDAKRFLIFEAESAIAKARAEALKRKATEEQARVEAEMRESAAAEAGKKGDAASKEAEKKGKKRKTDQKEEVTQGQAADASQDKKRRKRRRTAGEEARAAGALPDRDKVEEMDFSSGED